MPRALRTVLLSCALASALLAPASLAQKAAPVFEDGQAQVVDAFKSKGDWIQHDLWVETEFDSDGDGKLDRMHVDVTRPKQTDTEGLKVPVIYETSPYFAGTASSDRQFFWNPRQELGGDPPERKSPPPIKHQEKRPLMSKSLIRAWVPRGFAVVHSASPGTGLSQGCPTVGGANEALAPKAVIDWLNQRARGYTSVDGDEEVVASWCTGKVGMTGTSYNGTLPIAAATTGVEGLEVIIPVAPNTSYYHYYRSNGLVRHPGGWMGEDIDVLFDFIHSGYPDRRDYCNREVRDGLMATNQDRVTGDFNDFWAGRNYASQLDSIRAALLMAHGLNDWNVMPDHAVRIYEGWRARGVPAQIFLHQGGHGGGPPMEQMNRWFTHYLYGVESDLDEGSHAWVVREGEKRSNPTAYDDYPNPDAGRITLYPVKGGTKVGLLSTSTGKKSGTEKLVDDASISGAEHAQAEKSKHRLLYATPKLSQPVHISGRPRVRIRVSSSKPTANLSVWLVSLPWSSDTRNINDNVITRGWADPQNHASLTESEPLERGKFYELTFDLQPDDQIIPAGQQIGLMIFSSDKDFTLWPKPGTKLSVDLDATLIEIPVVGGAEALESAIAER